MVPVLNNYRDTGLRNITVTYPDLSVTKTDGVATYVPGSSVTYTIVFRNVGNLADGAAVITDAKPAEVTNWTWTCGAITGGATGCNGAASSANDFSDTVNLPAASSITYSVTANLASSATTNLVNTATVALSGGQIDPTPSNNTATDTDTPDPRADLLVTKTDGVLVYVPGANLTYTIVVSNAGPSDAPASTVTDNKPAQITSWTWTCGTITGGASGCSDAAASSNDFSDTVDLPAGSSITYTVTASIASNATGDLVNTVTVAPPAGVTDPTPGNNTDTDTDTTNPQADLQITKDDGVTQYVPGESVTYTIVVTNVGPSDAMASVVTDTRPTQILTWSWTCGTVTGGASGCSDAADSANDFSDTVDLPAGSSITYTVAASIASSATGDLVNTVTVTPPAGVTDPTPENNTATDTDTTNPQADLQITKDDGVTQYVPGDKCDLYDRCHECRSQRCTGICRGRCATHTDLSLELGMQRKYRWSEWMYTSGK